MAITFYPAEAAADGLRVFRDVFADAPDELMGVAIYWTAPAEEPFPPEWHGKPVFILAGCWSGPLERPRRRSSRCARSRHRSPT